MIAENYKPDTKVKSEDKERLISILNKIKYDLFDYYLDPNVIV